jgi:DNA transformation protein
MDARASEFLNYLLDQLGPLDGVRWRFMFGGVGLYRDEVMFGIVVDDALYLKTDDMNRAAFEAQGLAPLRYLREGREIALSYYQAPAEALEDPEELQAWVRQACDAALRSRKD